MTKWEILTDQKKTKKNYPIYQNLSDSMLGIVRRDFF